MNIIFVLIPIALVFVTLAIALFFWALKSDQFEDLDRQGHNILFDDDRKASPQRTGTALTDAVKRDDH